MHKLLVLFVLVGCQAAPAKHGKCHKDVNAYRDGHEAGSLWCQYSGYWWECGLNGTDCFRKAKLPGEAP